MAHVYRTLRNGGRTIQKLDNSNVYCTFLFESAANIAKDGMWMKLMNVYTLIVANGDRRVVGNCITANGLTRAAFAVFAGNFVINRVGSHTTMRIAGVAGLIGIAVNLLCFMEDSISEIFAINVIWAIFTGLSNACLETIFARSLLIEYREEVSTVRQSLNKATTAIGPLVSLTLFCFCGNEWTLPILHFVLNTGTILTLVAVFMCFMFDDRFETRQVASLCDVKRITLLESHSPRLLTPRTAGSGPLEHISVDSLTRRDFEGCADGPAILTYPLPPTSKYSRLKILHRDSLEPARYIIGKQYLARFKLLKRLQRNSVISVTFHDINRPGPVKATLENVAIFLSKGVEKKVDLVASKITFMQTEDAMLYSPPTTELFSARSLLQCCCPKRKQRARITDALRASSLTVPLIRGAPASAGKSGHAKNDSKEQADGLVPIKQKKKKKNKKRYAPNIWGANVIVCCDILNALGNGMSLKFMDLFLVQEYAYSPAALMILQFLTNCFSVYLTPSAKLFLQWIRSKNYHGKLGVIILWCISMTFLGIICIPGVPWWLVGLCIILRNSLNTCTKAYNRAKLANYLPHDKVASYMVWDSLNKANQGGIALFGAQLVHFGGYRVCFLVTLFIMVLRMLVYLSFVIRQHVARMAKMKRRSLVMGSPILRKSVSAGNLSAEQVARLKLYPPQVSAGLASVISPSDERRLPLLSGVTLPPSISDIPDPQLLEIDEHEDSVTSSAEEEDNLDLDSLRIEPGDVPSHLFRHGDDLFSPIAGLDRGTSSENGPTIMETSEYSEKFGYSFLEQTMSLGGKTGATSISDPTSVLDDLLPSDTFIVETHPPSRSAQSESAPSHGRISRGRKDTTADEDSEHV